MLWASSITPQLVEQEHRLVPVTLNRTIDEVIVGPGFSFRGPWIDGSLVKMVRTSHYKKSTFLQAVWRNRRKEFYRRTRLMHMVKRLHRMPFHLQKFFLSFMHGAQRAELARLLAAYRLQARLRKRGNARR